MLVTTPIWTGSSPDVNTTGIVEVADLAACAAGGPPAMITVTLSFIRSVINSGNRSYWPSAQRDSTRTFLPSTKPTSSRPLRYAAAINVSVWAEPLLTNPTNGKVCWARAENGRAATKAPPRIVMNSRRLIASPEIHDCIVAAQTCAGEGPTHVRFGSEADICSAKRHGRFT